MNVHQAIAADAGFRIGPNAIIQTGMALRAVAGPSIERQVFERAGLGPYLTAPPVAMIPEGEAAALFEALYAHPGLSDGKAQEIARTAGFLTADYILASRIPPAALRALRALPKALAARALLAAIAKHAWTFAGSGKVSCGYGSPLRLKIAANPLAFDRCTWHCAVFERLFGALTGGHARVVHAECCAAGDDACRFTIQV